MKAALNLEWVVCVCGKKPEVKKFAISTGEGGFEDFITPLSEMGFDPYLTGEIDYHAAEASKDYGIGLIGAAHHAAEMLGVRALKSRLSAELRRRGYSGVELHVTDLGQPLMIG